MNKTNEIVFRYLPLRISKAVYSLPREIFNSINEIRLRKNAPASLTRGTKNLFFDETGRLCHINSAIRATEKEMAECLSRLTGGSLYTCEEYISMGFIPLSEGGRAGICGKVMLRNGVPAGFSEINSIDLRIHRNIRDFAMPLVEEYRKNGLRGALVCSPPALGKTTFLRSGAYLLSSGVGISPKRVAIADERNEIAVGIGGTGIADILSGMAKSESITMLTRTMAPEIIICDEISPKETEALLEAQNTGVALLASAHCRTPADLKKRGQMSRILESGIFPLCVILEYDNGYKCLLEEIEKYL